jgi:hypothetical protein
MDIPVTSSIGVVIDDMTNNYSIFRQITSLDTGIQKEINDGAMSLQADITELINYRTTIQAQCANVVQTANTLYHHYIT